MSKNGKKTRFFAKKCFFLTKMTKMAKSCFYARRDFGVFKFFKKVIFHFFLTPPEGPKSLRAVTTFWHFWSKKTGFLRFLENWKKWKFASKSVKKLIPQKHTKMTKNNQTWKTPKLELFSASLTMFLGPKRERFLTQNHR